MLRMATIAALLLMETTVFAQQLDWSKGMELGVGCVGAINKFAPRLWTCAIDGSNARIWCPNGQIFDRVGSPPHSYVARSICNLNQVLD